MGVLFSFDKRRDRRQCVRKRVARAGVATGKRRPGSRFLWALILLGIAPSPLRANGIVRDSLGAISSGRGGANVAHDDNLSVINDNPAGLSWLSEDYRIELSNDFLTPIVEYSDPDGRDRSEETFFYLPQLSLAARVRDTPLTFGFSAYLPGGYGAEYDLEHRTYGLQRYESEGLLLKLLPAFSLKLGEHVSIGGGLGAGYSTAQLRLPYTFQTGALAGQDAIVDLETDGFGITGNFGIQFRPTERLTLGAAFISETFTEQSGDFTVDVTGSPLAALFTDPTAEYEVDFNLRWPRSVAAGGSYDLDWGRFSADFLWYNWENAFDDITFKLSNGDNPEFNAVAGSNPTERFPLDWDDSFSVRAGYEHVLTPRTTLRIGYIYNHNPIPTETLTPMLPGTLEHSVSAGIGHDFGDVEIHFAYQFAYGTKQEVGQSSIMGGDFDQSTVRAQAHWFFLTLAARF